MANQPAFLAHLISTADFVALYFYFVPYANFRQFRVLLSGLAFGVFFCVSVLASD